MRKCLYALFLFLASCTFNMYSQQANKDSLSQIGIATYDDYVKIRMGINNRFERFSVHDKASKLHFNLNPNQRIRTTFSVIYKFMEFDIGYVPKFLRYNNDDGTRGVSSFTYFGTRVYFGKWMQYLSFSRTKGFYVDGKELNYNANVIFGDLRVMKIGGSTTFVANRSFSFKSVYSQSEWPEKSSGSFAPMVNYYVTKIYGNQFSTNYLIDFGLGPSYHYNWKIFDRLMLSGGVFCGIGYNYTRSNPTNETPLEQNRQVSFQSQIRWNIGYNSQHFYSGFSGTLDSFTYRTPSSITVDNSQHFFEFYVGYRFPAPNKINNFINKQTHKLL